MYNIYYIKKEKKYFAVKRNITNDVLDLSIISKHKFHFLNKFEISNRNKTIEGNYIKIPNLNNQIINPSIYGDKFELKIYDLEQITMLG